MKKVYSHQSHIGQAEAVILYLTGLADKVLDDFIVLPHAPGGRILPALLKSGIKAVHTTVLRRLQKRGLLLEVNGKWKVSAVGRKYANGLVSDLPPKQWDGKWRFLIFDIPERRRRDRDRLRSLLFAYMFRKLQASVWVSPYNIPKVVHDAIWEQRLKYHIFYLRVDMIDYDKPLRELFPHLF